MPSDDPPAIVGTKINRGIGIAHAGQIAADPWDRFRDDVRMFDRIHGDRRTAFEAELTRPHSRTKHDLLGRHVAVRRRDADSAAVFAEYARDAHAFGDGRAALFGARGQGERCLLSIHTALGRQPHRAENVIRLQAAAIFSSLRRR